MLGPATAGLPVYSGVFSANSECCKLIGFSSCPWRNALCSGLWKCSCTVVLQSPRSFTVFMLNFLAWKYYLRIVYVWISHCTGREVWFLTGNPPLPPPALTTVIQCPGKTKSFLVAPPSWWRSYFQLLAFHGPKAVSPLSVKWLKLQSPPHPVEGQYSSWPSGRDGSVSAWLAMLLEVEFSVISNQLLQNHYSRDLA